MLRLPLLSCRTVGLSTTTASTTTTTTTRRLTSSRVAFASPLSLSSLSVRRLTSPASCSSRPVVAASLPASTTSTASTTASTASSLWFYAVTGSAAMVSTSLFLSEAHAEEGSSSSSSSTSSTSSTSSSSSSSSPSDPKYLTSADLLKALRPVIARIRSTRGLTRLHIPRLWLNTSNTPMSDLSLTLTTFPPDFKFGKPASLDATVASVQSRFPTAVVTHSSDVETVLELEDKSLTIAVSFSHDGPPQTFPQIYFSAPMGLSQTHFDGIVALFTDGADGSVKHRKSLRGSGGGGGDGGKKDSSDKSSSDSDPFAVLEKHGIQVVKSPSSDDNKASSSSESAPPSWDMLAGCDDIRKRVEETVLLPHKQRELYDRVMTLTRARPEKQGFAYLFAGPPGVGKTTAARIIAAEADCPLVLLNFESIGSMYHSESERNFKDVLEAIAKLDGAIAFIDEAESFFPARGMYRGSHNTSEKLLSQFLTFLEGFDTAATANTTVILATNRKTDLDQALRSRLTATITFDMPDVKARQAIWGRYAKHLSPEDCKCLATQCEGMSGRDIRKVAEVAEKRHIASLLRSGGPTTSPPSDASLLPPVSVYVGVAGERGDELGNRRGASSSCEV